MARHPDVEILYAKVERLEGQVLGLQRQIVTLREQARGPKGDKGDRGEKGEAGRNGSNGQDGKAADTVIREIKISG